MLARGMQTPSLGGGGHSFLDDDQLRDADHGHPVRQLHQRPRDRRRRDVRKEQPAPLLARERGAAALRHRALCPGEKRSDSRSLLRVRLSTMCPDSSVRLEDHHTPTRHAVHLAHRGHLYSSPV